MTKHKESTGEEIYSGTATFGRIMAVVGVVISTIAALIMIPLGIYFIVHKTKLVSTTNGTVHSVSCVAKIHHDDDDDDDDDDTIEYDCSLTVNYKVGNNSYSINTNTTSTAQYKEGDTITVYYDPNNPSNAALDADNTHVIGIIILVIGIIVPLVAWIWWYFARKYKAVAAAGGVAAGLDLLSDGNMGIIL